MGKIIIDTDICFECDEPAGEMHHVIPRVRGGTRTLPLCVKCHCKVHGLKNRPEHRQLVIEGLKKAKERGVKLGNPKNLTPEAQLMGALAMKNKALLNENNVKATPIIIDCRGKGYTYQKIANILNEMGYKTSRNKTFKSVSVHRIYKKLK